MYDAEIRPCPFCGGEGKLEYEFVNGHYQTYYSWIHVVCKKCFATTGRVYDDRDRSKRFALRTWNKRV